MHSRVCVSAISTFRLDLAGDLEFWAAHGIDCVGVSVAKLDAFGWDDGTARIVDSGVRVANLIGLGPFLLTGCDGLRASNSLTCNHCGNADPVTADA